MCATCGCGHSHPNDDHQHPHDDPFRLIQIERDLLAKNDRFAEENRSWQAERSLLALNLVSSPGAGKTSLLVRTFHERGKDCPFAVIEGDQQTSLDADRIRAAGAAAVQINTGRSCHLDAHQVGHALKLLNPDAGTIVMIENVGNLVCPAGFDLGEDSRVVVLSVTEGDDKPLKYPTMFQSAHLLILSKIDLLPYVDFDPRHCVENARRINPAIDFIALSVKTGEGLNAWYQWLCMQQTLKSGKQAKTA